MSVYTTFSDDDLKALLNHYELGQVQAFEGISAGITNTNYFLDTDCGRYVLTVFEQNHMDEMPYFMELMAHLNEKSIPCAHPLATKAGDYLCEFEGKPVALVDRLPGKTEDFPNLEQCRDFGGALADMHRASADFSLKRENDRGPHWWHETFGLLRDYLDEDDRNLLQSELDFQLMQRHVDCPRGTIHADLFPDNTLFDGDKVSGIIDYYYACHDVLLYDLAVSVNAWCMRVDGTLDEAKAQTLLQNYARHRSFNDAERAAWNTMLRAAALRFCLSRLKDMHFQKEGEMTMTKDPQEMLTVLRYHIAHPQQNQALIEGV